MEISRPSLEERAAECAWELTFSATVAYDGAPFAGFAKQPGQLTVQGELEQALSLLFRRPVDVVCAGRTDAGVHAAGRWSPRDRRVRVARPHALQPAGAR